MYHHDRLLVVPQGAAFCTFTDRATAFQFLPQAHYSNPDHLNAQNRISAEIMAIVIS